MRKIICLLLALLMFTALVACDTTPSPDSVDQSTDAVDTSADADAATTEAALTGKVEAPAYTGVFKTGYDRQDVTPSGEIKEKNGSTLTSVLDKLYVTCIAVNDGDQTLLLFTMDTGNIAEEPVKIIKERVSKATKVPENNIVISGTHTHSAPQPNFPKGSSANMKWDQQVYSAFQKTAQNAIADLTDSEIYIGTTLAKDMSFVRRWYLSDGTASGIWRQNSSRKDRVAYESDSDDLFQFIRFVRADKKDILLASWGIHFTSAEQQYSNAISADVNAYLRSTVEKLDDDINFAFYISASGNIAFGHHDIEPKGKYNSYAKMATDLAKQVVNEQDNLTRVEAGKINVSVLKYDAKVRKDDAATVEKAKKARAEIAALNLYDGKPEVYAVCAKYGFESAKDVSSVISRNAETREEYDRIKLVAISFGDIGVTGVPYEMFDTNGIELREASPFKMTIVITGCGGSAGYVPSALAVPNGGYEVYTTPWEFGTAEDVVAKIVEALRSHIQ